VFRETNQVAGRYSDWTMTVRSKPRMSIAPGRGLGWRTRKRPERPPPASGGGLDLVSSRHKRDAGSSQDRALYSCDCGLVFRAPVSTSVGCPECGSTQAW
jgi:hypothetical protein